MRPVRLAEKTRQASAVTVHVFAVALVLVAAGFVGLLGSAVAAASHLSAFAPLWNVAWFLVGIALILAFVGAVLYLVDMEGIAMIAWALAGTFVAVGGAGLLIQWIDDGGLGDDGDGDDDGQYAVDWDCRWVELAAAGPGGAHDASTEFPDSPFIAADGGTPDRDQTIATPVYDHQQRVATVDISVDDDAAAVNGVGTLNNAWLDEDTYAFDIGCKIANPRPGIGTATRAEPIAGHIRVTRTSGTVNNGTYAPVFYCDVTAGVYLGFGSVADDGATADAHDADHTYVSYITEKTCPEAPPADGDWINLGTITGDPDGAYIAVFFGLDAGISDYTAPPIPFTVSITIDVGTNPNDTGNLGSVETLRADLRVGTRT